MIYAIGSQPGVREEYQGVRLIFISFRFTLSFLVKIPTQLTEFFFFLIKGTQEENGWEPLIYTTNLN